jgi:hypothetical protein
MQPKAHVTLGVVVGILALALGLSGCAPFATPTFFVPPTESAALPLPPAGAAGSSPELDSTPGRLVVPSLVLPTPTPPCADGLTYVQDLTIPDGSNVPPGQSVDKQWQVKNSGTCNWDQRYRLKLISGQAMGANPLLPLYPARAGTQAVLDIRFTAPQSAGLYECHWQAVGPDGQPFGDPVYMQIAVTP